MSFLRQGIEEHQTLEYKPRGVLVRQDDTIIRSSNSREIKGFSELAKSVAGFANAEGGLLVLGVKEKPEKYRGETVKIRPGVISPLPINITREIIENELIANIQYPIEGITIVPLRSSPRSSHFIYLIDVPQSVRAPHRVNDLHYYQQYNFSTREMKHFQIADMFGRRFSPDLYIEIRIMEKESKEEGYFTVYPVINNRGKAIAKYTTCVRSLIDQVWEITQSDVWRKGLGNSWQFSTYGNQVLYPDVVHNTGYLKVKLISPQISATANIFGLKFNVYAENMTNKEYTILFDTERLVTQVFSKHK